MKKSIALLFVATSLVLCAGQFAYADELTVARFKQLHEELQVDASKTWRTIPWETDLLKSQRLAATQTKPIFIWAMDGHPLGCT